MTSPGAFEGWRNPRTFAARVIAAVLIALVCVALDRIIHRAFVDLVYNTLIRVCVFAILAASLNLINGVTGQFSLGHAAFMAIGGYAGGLLSLRLQPSLTHLSGWQSTAAQSGVYLAAIVLGAAFAVVAGLVVGLPTLRLRGDYLAIATLGFGEIVRVIFQGWERPFGGDTGMTGVPKLTTLGWALIFCVFCLILLRNLQWSGPGRDMMAVREDEVAAAAVGVDVVRAKVIAFMVAAGFAGAAGVVRVHLNGTQEPVDAGFMTSIYIVVMVVLGGTGSLTGSVIGAALITGYLAAFDGIPLLNHWSIYKNVLFPILLVVLMLARRQGLLGYKELSWKTYTRFFTRWRRMDRL